MKYQIVHTVVADAMAGDSRLERELNALITKSFISSRDMPSDECLREAKHLVSMGSPTLEDVAEYFIDQFSLRHAKFINGDKYDKAPQSIMDPYYSMYWDVAADAMALIFTALLEGW